MNSIILIAPPAGGKGTQSNMLKAEYNIPHISTGDLLRGASNDDSEISKQIKEIFKEGKLVPDEIVLELLRKRITESDCDNGYILDGFPRTVPQAEAYENILKSLGKEEGYVILLETNKEDAAARIANRVSCPNCGRVFNNIIDGLKPQVENQCDDCKTALIHRDDDNAETYEKRYDEYILKTQPLIDFYKKKNILYTVDNNIDVDNTFSQIKNIIGE